MELYNGAFTAEERFLATLIMMSPYSDWVKFGENGRAKSLTYIGEMEHKYHPPVVIMDDIPKIEQSGAFFARKFDLKTNPEVIMYFHKKICKS